MTVNHDQISIVHDNTQLLFFFQRKKQTMENELQTVVDLLHHIMNYDFSTVETLKLTIFKIAHVETFYQHRELQLIKISASYTSATLA